MRIHCPNCGERSNDEFVYRGDASPMRPTYEAAINKWVDYVYFRENPAGLLLEHWLHASGCRAWLTIGRNTRTHAIESVALAEQAR